MKKLLLTTILIFSLAYLSFFGLASCDYLDNLDNDTICIERHGLCKYTDLVFLECLECKEYSDYECILYITSYYELEGVIYTRDQICND